MELSLNGKYYLVRNPLGKEGYFGLFCIYEKYW